MTFFRDEGHYLEERGKETELLRNIFDIASKIISTMPEPNSGIEGTPNPKQFMKKIQELTNYLKLADTISFSDVSLGVLNNFCKVFNSYQIELRTFNENSLNNEAKLALDQLFEKIEARIFPSPKK